MRPIKLLLLLFLVVLTSVVYAQTGTIQGIVIGTDGSSLEAVNVQLESTTKGSVTNVNGEYEIKEVAAGSYELIISSIGYQTQTVGVSVRIGETTVVKPLVIEKKGENLSEVLVLSKKSRYVEENASTSLRLPTELYKVPQNIQVINSELLKDQLVTNMMEGVIRNVSGVTMLEHWGHFARVHMRGFRIPAFRNGFNVSDTWGPLAEDMAFTDRVEFVKGPSGFMITAGEPGGIYNVVTKAATEQTIKEVTLMGGSFDFLRASIDLGGKLSSDGKLLYRFNGLYQTADTHRGNEQSP
ncbi:MAG: carboxypeptidase-like regulatory domain-containing protein, partial [Bacteroidota bacterium]